MLTGSPTELDSLLREVMSLLRRAYDLGRSDALRDAVAILDAEAAAKGQEQAPAPAKLPRRRGVAECARPRGRPDSMTEEHRTAAAALLAEGLSLRRIAMEIGVSPSRLYRWMRERELAE